MEHIEDDRSEVLAAAEVHRGGLQPLAHAASNLWDERGVSFPNGFTYVR